MSYLGPSQMGLLFSADLCFRLYPFHIFCQMICFYGVYVIAGKDNYMEDDINEVGDYVDHNGVSVFG